MASNVIDYFATLGRKSLICKSFESLWTNDKLRTPSEIWNEAITDIAIVHPGEQLPDSSWQLINRSIDNRQITSRSTIAIRRRGASGRLDHITKIKLIRRGDNIPLGFELIDRSVTKMFLAEIENIGVLAVKRAHASDVAFIQGQPLVDDICVVLTNEGEEVPEGYVSLDRVSTQKEAGRAAKTSQTASKLVLAYHQRPAMGLCDLSYESTTLDRYPQKDQHEFPLPVVELPMFAFPHDLRLSYSSTIRFPLPVFFSFVFTNSKGMHRYAACLRFYEIVPREEIEVVFREVYGSSQEFVMPQSTAVFCPKIICVVSRMPFYRAMRRYLCQIFSMSLSSLPCPLEFFIASVVGQVPLPVAGGRPFHVVQDAALISSTSCAMNAIEFEVPLPRFFPPMDLDFAAPLRCLSVDRLLAVFALMLRESKMVFLCCSNTLLTETMETLRSLLFPLKWSSCFVSRLPDVLSGLLEAPGGFMIGLHMFEDKDNDVEVTESTVDKHFGDRKAVRQTQWTHSLTAGTFIVDLSANAVFQYDGKSVETPLSTAALNNLAHTLPPGPRRRLQRKLQLIATSYCIGPQTVGLDRFDSAFDFQAYEDLQEPAAVTALSWDNFPTLEIRDCFMNFMADLIGNYQKYIIPPLEDMSAETYRTFKEEFSVEEYLSDAGPTVRPVLEMLVETQMFAVLLQQRSEASDYSLVFFESAGELMREHRLQAGGHNFKDLSGNSFNSSNSIPDMVAPLYKLLAAKAWAAANGKYYHTNEVEKDPPSESNDSPSSYRDSLDQSSVHDGKPEEKKYFSSMRSQSSRRKSFAGSPPFIKKDSMKAVKILSPLDCLVIALDEMEADSAKRSFLGGITNTPRKRGVVGSRDELDRRANLRLHDRSLGPLIIPGPSRSLLHNSLPHAASAGRRHSAHDAFSADRVDDTNSVVTCSTDVSDDDSVSPTLYSRAIAEFGASPLNHEEVNYLMALVSLRSEQNNNSYTEDCGDVEYESDVERDSEGRFTYQIGWPVLHSKLLKLARRSVHTRLSGLRKSRVFALQMINRNIQLFLRAPTEQWACYRSIVMNERGGNDNDSVTAITPRNSSPASHSSQNSLRALLANSTSASLAAESQEVVGAVLEVLSVSLLLLCTRTLHEAKPVCDMLQVLGILAQADSMGMLPLFDETVWRTLLVACASTGGDVMRKVACVIFDSLTACGITPDALTYGSYTRALAATKYVHEISPHGQQIDQFLFLEEIGLAWFQKRSAVIEQVQADISIPEPRNHPSKSSGMLSTMFSRKKRTTVNFSRRRASSRIGVGLETTGASDAAVITAAQLGLIRPEAVYALLCPPGVFVSATPRYAKSFQPADDIDELSLELSSRVNKLMLDYKSNPPPTWQNNRALSCQGKSSNSPNKPNQHQCVDNRIEEEDAESVSACDLGLDVNSEALKDLIGPGASTVSNDSIEAKSSIRDDESRSSAYMSSALVAAVSGSSSAASAVKHYGNILIGGSTAPRRSTGTAPVPVEVLQNIVKLQSPVPDNLIISDTLGSTPAQSPKFGSASLSRMSSMTRSVFQNPFQTKEKDKMKDMVENMFFPLTGTNSTNIPQTFSAICSPQLAPEVPLSNVVNPYADVDEEEETMEKKASAVSNRFSDDEADDSDDDLLSRRSSSASIRIKESNKEKNSRKANSFPQDEKKAATESCHSESSLEGISRTGSCSLSRTGSCSPSSAMMAAEHSEVFTDVPSNTNSPARIDADEKDESGVFHSVGPSNPIKSSVKIEPDFEFMRTVTSSTPVVSLDELLFCPADTVSLIGTPYATESENLNGTSHVAVVQNNLSLEPVDGAREVEREREMEIERERERDREKGAVSPMSDDRCSTPEQASALVDSESPLEHIQQLQHESPKIVTPNTQLTPSTVITSKPSTPPTVKRLNVLAMQTDVLSSFSSAFVREGCAVGIHCATPCPLCAHTLLDEEVMAIWAGADPRDPDMPSSGARSGLSESSESQHSQVPSLFEKAPDTPPVSSVFDMRGSDIEAAHCISCPACSARYCPQLHVACYELNPGYVPPQTPEPSSPYSTRLTSVAEWTPTPSSMLSPGSAVPSSPQPSPLVPPSGGKNFRGHLSQMLKEQEQTGELNVLWRESVAHLSPKGLRLALEEQMERIGERVADPCWLHVHRPAVYWNILWFSSRLIVPTGFLASPPQATIKGRTESEPGSLDSTRQASQKEGIGGTGMDRGPGVSVGVGVGGVASPPPMWHLPTIIGWRESIVRRKVFCCLTKLSPKAMNRLSTTFSLDIDAIQSGALQLADVFPRCNETPLDMPHRTANGIAYRASSGRPRTLSTSLSPADRSVSSPSLATMLRSRSSSTPIKMRRPSAASPEISAALTASVCSTPQPASKSSSPARLPRTRLESAAEFLDGTAEGMRRAILEIGKYEWLVYEAKSAAAYHAREEAAKKEMEYDGEGKDGTVLVVSASKEEVVSGPDRGPVNDSNGADDEPVAETELEVEADEEADWMKFKATRREAHTISRDIYVDLLMLFYMQKCKKSPESVSGKADHSGKLLDQFKESPFEKLYLSVVRELLSAVEFEILGTTESAMVNCMAGKSAQAFRIGMGFLL